MSKASAHQSSPTQGKEIVLYQVISDLNERARVGEKRYGTLLKTHNGRDALWDAYQEALDLCMYLRQAIMEKEDGST